MKKAYIALIIFFAIISTAAESEFGMSYARNQSWAELKLKEMTLREKIAQMIVTYSDGYALD